MWLEIGLLGGLALFCFYRWATANNDFFKRRSIPYSEPSFMTGNFRDMLLRRRSMFDIVLDLYNQHSGRVCGIFDQRQPIYLLRDPELIKQVTIKDFDHFVNHRNAFGEADGNNLFASSLFLMRDGRWKDMRSTLSPAFTGSKMRHMFQLISKVAQETVAHLRTRAGIHGPGVEVDVKDWTTRFTNDVIASTAFGIEVNSFADKDNEFYRMGKTVTTFTAWQNLKFFLVINFRSLSNLLGIELFDKKYTDYFMRLVLDAMKYRQENNISRPDMINLLMEARGMIKSDYPKACAREWSDVDIVAQCFLFFFAGFDTAAVLMCFAAHELMENQEIQQKLLVEIEQVTRELDGGPLTYEALQGMRYMDMVISEVLRKWPPAIAIDRMCNKDFVYEAHGDSVRISKDEYVWIPVCGLHHDPKYFPDPEKFDPERFSEENRDRIVPCSYMPFGVGPRNCIGSRFAQLEAKALVFYLVRDFRIEAATKTTRPMKLAASGFQLMPKNGFWLKFVARSPA